jgi:hypothetical protein
MGENAETRTNTVCRQKHHLALPRAQIFLKIKFLYRLKVVLFFNPRRSSAPAAIARNVALATVETVHDMDSITSLLATESVT